MFFKRKPKPPLAEAIRMVGDATEIAYQYLRDRKRLPTDEELRLLDELVETLWANQAAAQSIARNMHQRSRGEPEGPRKFTDPAVAAYYYGSYKRPVLKA